MANKNIFTIGGTVQAGEGIYIPRHADDQLLDLCREGAFSYILTPRQMGKSSLMLRTAERLKSEGISSVTIDLQEMGTQSNAEQWYLGILTRIEDALSLETDVLQWWSDNQHLGMTHRLTQFFRNVLLTERSEQIIIFIDEIDTTLSLDFTDDFFIAIRYLYNGRADIPAFKRLSFVLIGVATPGDLIADPQRTPFNIGRRVDLSDFTLDEARPLTSGFQMPLAQAEQVLSWVLSWTGGHPYLTQKLCAAIAVADRQDWTESDIDAMVARTFFDVTSEEDHNLQFVRDMLTKQAPQGLERDTLITYREIYQDKKPVLDDEQSIVKNHLKLSGVVKRKNRNLQLRNAIYREVFNLAWIKEHLPIDLLKRLRRIFALLVLSIVLITILAGTTWWAIESRKEANRQKTIAEIQKLKAERQQKIAEDSTLAAQQQRKRVIDEKNRAEKFAIAEAQIRTIAELERRRAMMEKLISDSLRNEAEKSRKEAFSAFKEIMYRRYIDIARFLATQASIQQQASFNELAVLLARQAFLFNDRYGGHWGNEIYNALLKTLNGAGGPFVLEGHTAAVRSVVFDQTGKMLASGSDDGTIRIWNPYQNDVEPIVLSDHNKSVRSLMFNPINQRLVSVSDDYSVRLWNIESFKPNSKLLNGHNDRVWTVAVSADGKMLATGGADSTLMLWDLNNFNSGPWARLKQNSWIRAVAFSSNGHWLAAGCEDGALKIWACEKANFQIFTELKHGGGIRSLAFSPDNSILVTGDANGRILQWSLNQSGAKAKVAVQFLAHQAAVNSVTFSSDGKLLASASSDKQVKVWDVNHSSNEPLLILDHDAYVWSVSFSPDGSLLASACADKIVRIWYTKTATLAEIVCSVVQRNLTMKEWVDFIGTDIDYEHTCKHLSVGESTTTDAPVSTR